LGNTSITAQVGASLAASVTVEVQASVTTNTSKIVMGANSTATLTAGTSFPSGGTYFWEIISTQSGDDPTIAQLQNPLPSCNGQGSCAVTITGSSNGGKVTIRVHLRSQATGQDVSTVDVRLIVVQFTQISAVVPPSYSSGNSITQSSTIQVPSTGLTWPSSLWPAPASGAQPTALVLLKQTPNFVTLNVVTTPPATDLDLVGYLGFQVFGSSDDWNVSTRIGTPSIAPLSPPVNGTASLAPNVTGSWQVVAFADINQSGQLAANQTGVTLPVIIVDASYSSNAATVSTPNGPGPVTTAGQVNASCSSISGPPVGVSLSTGVRGVDQSKKAIVLEATVALNGGGPDGSRGADRVSGGWFQTLTGIDIKQGAYLDGKLVSETAVTNASAASGNTLYNLPEFVPGGPTPNLANPPFLDTAKPPKPLTVSYPVADSFSLSNSSVQGRNQSPPHSVSLTVQAWDSPGVTVPYMHPVSNAIVTTLTLNMQLTSYLLLWADSNPGSGGAGTQTYALQQVQPWQVQAGATISNFVCNNIATANTVTLGTAAVAVGQAPTPISSAQQTPVPLLTPPLLRDLRAYDVQH
jgi:hypothetical protein